MTRSLLRRVRRAAARARTGAWGTRCEGAPATGAACARARYHCAPRSYLPPRIAIGIAHALGGYRG